MRIVTLCVVIFAAAFAHAQAPALPAPVCNAEFAQLLVEQQVMEGKSVTDPVKRIKILNRSADFLWQFDEPTARKYFAESWKMADDRFEEKGFESKTSGNKESQIIQLLPDQRMEVVRAIAKRDKEWAKKLADQILADFEKTAKERKGFDSTRELFDIANLATQYAASDPELSLLLMRRVMKYELHSGWFGMLYSLAQNKTLADTVYAEALNSYRNETPRKLLYLSAYPFARPRLFGFERYNMMHTPPEMPINDALARRFLEVFFTRIAAFAASEADLNRTVEQYDLPEAVYMVTALNDIEPLIIERYPDLLGRFGEARAQAASVLSDEARKKMEDRDKQYSSDGLSFEERIKELEEAESKGKLTDYMIVKMVIHGELTDEQLEILKSWLDKIKEEKPRGETINYFWTKRTQLAIKEKRFDDAEKYAAKVPELEHRAVLFFDLAKMLGKNQNDSTALFETLNRVSKLGRSAENSVPKAQVLLGLANLFEKVNHSTAMDELSEAIRVTNSLKDSPNSLDVLRSSVSRQITGKGYSFFTSYSVPGFDLEKTFEELSKKDFEISLGQAKSLDDRYFRTLAVIAVAGNCAKNAKKPAAKPKAKAN